MRRRSFNQLLLVAGAAGGLPTFLSRALAASAVGNYSRGDSISPEAFVLDSEQRRHTLVSLLLGNQDTRVNLLFIFGGGDMGGGRPGGIWCGDSFNDMHILRTLAGRYRKGPVGIIPVACAPVYSTQFLDFPKRVFLDYPEESAEFQEAAKAFIDSTQAAVEAGIIPMQPWYDLRLRTMMSRAPEQMPSGNTGNTYSWQGSFRAADETQNYGVTNFWVLSPDGVVLTDPFRGNIYHPHSGPVQINYTLSDIESAILSNL